MVVEEEKESLIKEIVERELNMFLATPNEGGTSPCQTRPQSFRLMRRMNHCTHDKATLESYLQDLRDAEEAGRNVMIEKYARMDDRIPPLSESPLLDAIADMELEFLVEAARQYPHTIKVGDHTFFRKYMRCELETLSDRTLELYAEELKKAREESRNPVLERYDYLWSTLGEGSLAEYENRLAAKR